MVLVGVTGYGCAVLFVLHGAPDLALTQVLVETVTPRRLRAGAAPAARSTSPTGRCGRPATPGWRSPPRVGLPRWARFVLVARQRPHGDAGLGDVRRSWPTTSGRRPQHRQRDPGRHPGLGHLRRDLGAGRRRDRRGQPGLPRRPLRGRSAASRRPLPVGGSRSSRPAAGRRVWLPGPRTLSPDRRSIVFEVVTRLLFHDDRRLLALPALRRAQPARRRLRRPAWSPGWRWWCATSPAAATSSTRPRPSTPGVLIGAGLFVAALSGLGPMAFGGSVLQTADVDVDLPLLGEVHLVTSLVFDIGVYLVVVGLVLDLLRTFGSRAGPPDPARRARGRRAADGRPRAGGERADDDEPHPRAGLRRARPAAGSTCCSSAA